MKLTPIEPREPRKAMIYDDSSGIERAAFRAGECPALEFGRFRVLLRQRQLLANGAPIELGTRAFDVLVVLIEANGSLVTKDELLTRVWPGIVVTPDNLKVQICALRNALGAERDVIRTDSGRGYRFTGTVRRSIVRDPGRCSAPVVMETPARREAALTTELATIATQLADLEGKLARVVRMLNGPSQHDAAKFPRHGYCVRSPDHTMRQIHAPQRRRIR